MEKTPEILRDVRAMGLPVPCGGVQPERSGGGTTDSSTTVAMSGEENSNKERDFDQAQIFCRALRRRGALILIRCRVPTG